ncbi:MAG: crossover junction endodeoxyribonuclease RuvC [Sedimentisphaerales bacterium]|nr:crossover junction endodeoxyribonuclease RuvC [Sedimentisphaerales bacterium]
MKVLGVDPGLRTSGYAVIALRAGQVQVLDAGTIRAAEELPLARRLAQIFADADALLAEHAPNCMAIEELYAHYRHPRTAILMGHARGMFLLAAAQRGIAVRGYAATRIKKSLTGSGRASKQQMQRAVQTQLQLARLPEPADVADALAVAMCCVDELSKPTGAM